MNKFVMKHFKVSNDDSIGIDDFGFPRGNSGFGGGCGSGETLAGLRDDLKKEKELTNNQNLIILKIINMLNSLGDTNEEVNTALISNVFLKYIDKFTAGKGDDFNVQKLLNECKNHVKKRLDRI